MPPNFSNRSAIRFMAFCSAAVSPEGRNRYQRANCSLSAFSTSSTVGNPFIIAPYCFPLYHTSNMQPSVMVGMHLLILQIELSLTQVLDRPVTGGIFFEEVIRENLDIGRPKQVQLIFDRWVTKTTTTPGLFRTRVITDGVVPSLHVDYKGTRIKQYHKERRARRTETTINNAEDFYVGKRLHNLPALRGIGFQANRRLLEVEKITHDCILAEETFQQINRPRQVASQRASALRFGDPHVQALWSAWLMFTWLPTGLSNRNLREHFAPLLGRTLRELGRGQRWGYGIQPHRIYENY